MNVLLVAFFIITLFIGWISCRKEDTEGFLLANRKLGTFQSVMTICASFVGGMSLLVYPAFVFTFGISAMWIFIGYLIGFVFFSFFAFYLKKFPPTEKFYTFPDYFLHKFGKNTARCVIILIVTYYFGSLTIQFIGSGKILSTLSGFDYVPSVLIVGCIVMIYLMLGGFNSVVKTDIFQFIVLGILIVIIASVLKTGSQVPLTHMNPFNAGPVYIAAFLMLGILRLFAAQDYWQRVYAMKDEKVVKKSFVISGILLCLVAVILTYIGLVARTQFPFIDPDLAVLYSFKKLVPETLTGLVSVAFFAAILSSADTVLFMLGMNISHDLMNVKENKRYHTRLAVAGVGVASLLLALIFRNLVDLSILIKSIGLILPPIVLFIWRTEGDKNGIISSIVLSSILVIGFAIGGFLRPELSFIAIFGSTLFYWGTIGVRKIFS